jgi:predicted aspartyl protease
MPNRASGTARNFWSIPGRPTAWPGKDLRKAGIKPVGKTAYELADGQVKEFEFGLAAIRFMGEITSGRVIFADDGTEPLLGVTALESVGILFDAANKTLNRLPAIPLK